MAIGGVQLEVKDARSATALREEPLRAQESRDRCPSPAMLGLLVAVPISLCLWALVIVLVRAVL